MNGTSESDQRWYDSEASRGRLPRKLCQLSKLSESYVAEHIFIALPRVLPRRQATV